MSEKCACASRAADAAQALDQERETRADLEEQLKTVRLRHAAEVNTLSVSLQVAQEQVEQLRAALQLEREPSGSRWQREALKLQEDLVEARKAWKAVDTRSLIRRDKELARLGLDAQAVEEMPCASRT
ncbi:unnamed protein product [Effrenium voratum]|uniref:Uncharacterized protein n=1 Tax=Effrenium voratum TaxID=2562239 RepID=A0AA36HJV6_9DINO|nr:unnamed protein product [Effrenium voratum]CAJ1432329.1 unnamed protein product [Effrenium voratum]